MNLRPHAPLALLALPLLFGCDKVSDVTDNIGADVESSYCEALCDWAVACAAEEREVDEAALRQQCLDATHAADSSCAEAEAGELSETDAIAVNTCVDAIEAEQAAGECGAWTGSYDELATSAMPADCAGLGAEAQDTFEAAQQGASESNDELCTRMTHEYCLTLEECLLGEIYDGEIPQEVLDLLGGTPVQLCETRLDGITSGCIEDNLYAPEESRADLNTARQAARECLEGLAEMSCSDLWSGDVPKVCSAAFSSAEDGLEFFGALFDLFTEFSDAAG
jgi:hypothetical protein